MGTLKIKDLLPIAHLRKKITMSAANTMTEATINTNINPLSNQIIAIHSVTFDHSELDTPAVGDDMNMVLTKQSKSTIVDADDPDQIAQFRKTFMVLTDGGNWDERSKKIDFNPPELVASDELYLQMSTSGQAAAESGTVDIRYTPVEVSDADFVKLAKF